MIVNNYYKTRIADIGFTSIPLCEDAHPYFADKAKEPYVMLSHNDIDKVYWRNYGQIYWVFLKVRTGTGALTLQVYDATKQEALFTTGMYGIDVINPDAGWNMMAGELVIQAPYNNLELRLYVGSSLVAFTPLAVHPNIRWNECLTFDYFNVKADMFGFPFGSIRGQTGMPGGFTFTAFGGIQIGATKCAVEREAFRDQRYTPKQLSANVVKTATLTVGSARGVPENVGEIINNILCCDTIYLNGKRIARSGDSVPEPVTIAKGYPYVNFSVDIEYINTNPDDVSTLNL